MPGLQIITFLCISHVISKTAKGFSAQRRESKEAQKEKIHVTLVQIPSELIAKSINEQSLWKAA